MQTAAASDFQPIVLGSLDDEPLVSVLTSNHNYGSYVGEAIESVLAQTYAKFEMIICDDGSTDDSIERIKPHTELDNRVRLVRKRNGGQASAWNQAYANCSGSIICILDSDDLFMTNKVDEVVRAFHQSPDAGLIVHPMNVVDQDGTFLWQTPRSPDFERGWIGPQIVKRGGGWKSMFGSALCFRRELAEVIFPIPEDFSPAHADVFVVQIGPLLTPVSYCQEALSKYRFHGQNVTNDAGTSMDLSYLQSRAERGHRIGTAVNRRLEESGFSDRVLPVRRDTNLAYMASLVDSSSLRQRVPLLVNTLRVVVREDYHPLWKRAAKAAILSVPLVLPRPLRIRILDRFFSSRSRNFTRHNWQIPNRWREFWSYVQRKNKQPDDGPSHVS